LLIDLPYSAPLAATVALVPAVLRWWWGRSLAPLADDPAFPERLVAHRMRGGRSFGVSCALLLVLFTDTLLWSLPLLILSCTTASFQFRRVIYQESWGLGAYLSFVIRAIVAVFGFWLVLAALPALASLAAPRDWLAALLLGGVLALWNARYTETVRFLLRAKPVDHPVLAERFVALAQASTAGMPHFEQVTLGGGAIANAIALPSVARSAVLFTDTLLSRLDENESVAICGHELAHLEYYNRQRMRKQYVGNLLLIAGSLVTVAAARAIDSSWIPLSIVWPAVVAAALGWRARHRQQHETESDVRAVALTGDPDALATALTKIHAYAHVPRRVDAELEQHASHPSLARRIQAIRAATPGPKPPATASATFVGTDGHTQVTFADERLEWREGDAALHSLAYTRLTELRVQVPASGQPRLLVVERGGRRWHMTLASDDVARAQGVLDLVDGNLAEPTTAPTAWPAAQRVFTLIAMSLAVLSGQIATMIVALMAMFRPSTPLVAAAGAAMIAGAGLSRREADWAGLDLRLLPLGLVATGGFLLWTAWKARAADTPATTGRIVVALGLLSAVALGAVVAGGTDIVRAHQSARMLPGSVVWPIAFAAALACYPYARARAGAAAAILVGVAMATLGSIPFLDRFGSDPLLLPAEAMTQVHVADAPAAEFALPFYAIDVRLSPGGVYLAAHDARRGYDRQNERSSFEIGRLGRQFSSVSAGEVAFLDDEHLLTVRENDEGTEIDDRPLTHLDVPVWRQLVPGLFGASMTLDRQAHRWRLLGWDAEHRILRARGTIGSPDIEITRWPSPIDRKIWATIVGVSENHALVVETQYDLGGLDMLSVRTLAAVLNPGATVSRLWQVGQDSQKDLGTSRIVTDCTAEATTDGGLVCTAFDGTRTRLVELDPATGERRAIGVMDGRFAGDKHPAAGWLTGWRDSTPVAIRLATRQVVTLPQHQYGLAGIATSERWLATVSVDGTNSKVRLFPLP